jgi:hypothetical protein
MPAEIDFSGGVRGKFYHAGARLNVPVYLDAEVQAYLAAIAKKISELANDLLKKEICEASRERRRAGDRGTFGGTMQHQGGWWRPIAHTLCGAAPAGRFLNG